MKGSFKYLIHAIIFIVILILIYFYMCDKGKDKENYINIQSYLTQSDISNYPTNPPLPKACLSDISKRTYPCLYNHFVWTSPTTIDYKWSTSSLQSALWWNGDKGIRYPYMQYATKENEII